MNTGLIRLKSKFLNTTAKLDFLIAAGFCFGVRHQPDIDFDLEFRG